VIVIKGRPITKKNSQQIIRKGRSKRPSIIQSKQYLAYEEAALWQLSTYSGPRFKNKKLHVVCRYWMPNRRSWPDLIGLMQSTWDILEKAEIIDNDRNIFNPDGSRIMGIDKNNPRVEIEIKEAVDYELQKCSG